MVHHPLAIEPDAMRSLGQPTRSAGLDADNELYDRGCDLVQAAAGIRRMAESPEAVRAVPAMLGCFESAFEELLCASALLEQTTYRFISESPRGIADAQFARRVERMHLGFANLQWALADGQRTSAAARGLARRAIAFGHAGSAS
jgi:hypothetical protein